MIEMKKMHVEWSEDDASKVEMLRVKNIRYLSLKNSKAKPGTKENVLRTFCEKKGLGTGNENWRRKAEEEIELKETRLKDLLMKKKLTKSKKKKLELFMECKVTLQTLVKDWKETPSIDEERVAKDMKERIVMAMRMKNVVINDDENIQMTRLTEDEATNVENVCLTVEKFLNVETIGTRDDCCVSIGDKKMTENRGKKEMTLEMTQKTTNNTLTSSDGTSQPKAYSTAKTTGDFPMRQVKQKKALDVIPAKASQQK